MTGFFIFAPMPLPQPDRLSKLQLKSKARYGFIKVVRKIEPRKPYTRKTPPSKIIQWDRVEKYAKEK